MTTLDLVTVFRVTKSVTKSRLHCTSITACIIHKNIFSAPLGIFYVKTEIWKQNFQKNPPNCKLLFPNGSYRNGDCRALWAKSPWVPSVVCTMFSSLSIRNFIMETRIYCISKIGVGLSWICHSLCFKETFYFFCTAS